MAETEPLTELAYQAESGDAQAQYRLGVLFLLGERVEQDLGAARRWFHAAAANGNHGAERIRRFLSPVSSNAPALPSRKISLRWLAPVVALLFISLQSGYEFRRKLDFSPHTSYSSPTAVVNPVEEGSAPDLQTRAAVTSDVSNPPELPALEKNAKKPTGVRHLKRRSHR